MKKQATVAMCALALLFAGCAPPPAEPTQKDDSTTHLATIATLEQELREQKENFYITESKYKAEIQSLREQLEALSEQATGEREELPEQATFRYRIEDGGAIITGYTGNISLLSIPEQLDGYPVVAIAERAFEGCGLTAVVLPEGVRYVGWFAFYGCKGLLHVTLPASLESIGYAVFDGCERLTIFCSAGSFAEAFAKSYGLNYFSN